eukprot:364254-Chlamydomonas_euryale.AAC.10
MTGWGSCVGWGGGAKGHSVFSCCSEISSAVTVGFPQHLVGHQTGACSTALSYPLAVRLMLRLCYALNASHASLIMCTTMRHLCKTGWMEGIPLDFRSNLPP